LKSPFLFSFFLVSTFFIQAQNQLRFNHELPPSFLVKKILVGDNPHVDVHEVNYIGHNISLGAFSNASKYYLMKKGIILTTGSVEEALGPNDRPDAGAAVGYGGDVDLQKLATGRTYDACVLSFVFSTSFDSISFNYLFASEEYPEYVNKKVNDIFAFFIEEYPVGEKRNIAVLPGTGETVNVDNINYRKNPELYIQNAPWNPYDVMQWEREPGRGELSLSYQYDGFTAILAAGSKVEPGKKYKITLAIADVGDPVYDSAVLLESNSFKAHNRKGEISMADIGASLKDLDVEVQSSGNNTVVLANIHFDFDLDQTDKKEDLQILSEISNWLKLNMEYQVKITGHTDNFGSDQYNLDLSKRRAQFAANYLESNGVGANRFSFDGMGDHIPVAENITEEGRARNRRIEFEFFKAE
jgi:outer membrane protein OmpA-like peptidoglycan-associated protein